MKRYLFFTILFLAALGCEKNRITVYDEGLIGYWITPVYGENSIVTYDRGDGFINGYGIAFLEDGALLERKNVGWCGTPPITYGDYQGTWMEGEDGFIYVTSEYWGGIQELTFKLISVDEEHLVLEIIN